MKELLGNKWENSPTLFTSETGGFVSLNSITSSWIRFIKSNNLKPIPLKGLRTSFATYLAYNNYPPKVVQSLLGHSSERTTMQFYEFAYDDYATSILETTNNIGSGIKNEKN
jgi:integrase